MISFACFTGVASTGGDRRRGPWCEGWRALPAQTDVPQRDGVGRAEGRLSLCQGPMGG